MARAAQAVRARDNRGQRFRDIQAHAAGDFAAVLYHETVWPRFGIVRGQGCHAKTQGLRACEKQHATWAAWYRLQFVSSGELKVVSSGRGGRFRADAGCDTPSGYARIW